MKKVFFYAAAALSVLASCSKETVENAPVDGDNVAIALNLASPSVIATRGTGTIGDTKESGNNVWHGQPIYVIMTDEDFNFASYKSDEESQNLKGQIYPDVEFIAPGGKNQFVTTSVAGAVERADAADHMLKYYPHDGKFNFYGYALGLEPGAERKTAEPDPEDGFYKVEVKIDGSQDLMTAVAPIDKNINGVDASKLYSAYAARSKNGGVQPTLNFNHELARFTFKVKAGNDNALGGNHPEQAVRIKKVVMKSKYSGKMIVARPDATRDENNIEWDQENKKDYKELELKQRIVVNGEPQYTADLIALEEQALASKDEYVQVGNESLLVAPGDEEYECYIEVVQLLPLWDGHEPNPGIEPEDQPNTFHFPLKASEVKKADELDRPVTITKFEAGKAYNVNIIVYGSEEIVVNTTLAAWENGGDIDIDPDDM